MLCNRSEGCQMAEHVPPLTSQNVTPAPDENTLVESETTETDALTETDLLEDELEELVIEDFTIDGICGVY